MKSVGVAVLLAMGALAYGAEDRAIVDVSGLIRPVRDERAPRLGIELLRARSFSWGYPSEPQEEPAGRIPIETLALLLEDAIGAEGSVTEIESGLLLLDHRFAESARSCLRGFLDDFSRRVRIGVVVTCPDGSKLSGEILTRPGRWGRVVRERAHTFVHDFDVELACDNSGGYSPSVVGDPIVDVALSGFAAEIRPFLINGGRTIALEASLQVERLSGMETNHTGARFLGAIELPSSKTAKAVFSGAVLSGTSLVSRFLTVEGEFVIRLTPELEGRPGKGKLRLLDAGLATVGPVEVGVGSENADGFYHHWEAEAVTERLLIGQPPLESWDLRLTPEAEISSGVAETLRGGELAVAGPAAFQRNTRRRLDMTLAPLARTARLEVTIRAGDEVLGRAELSALHGRTAFLRFGVDRNMVRDHDVEVGCYVQIADPVVTGYFDGVLIRARPRFAPDSKTITLTIDARLQGFGASPKRRELHEQVCGSVQLLALPARVIRSELVLAAGSAMTLSAGVDPKGRKLELRVRSLR